MNRSMRPLSDLIDGSNRGHKLVRSWLKGATNQTEAPLGKDDGATLSLLQVTTASPMGAIAFELSGIFVDAHWIRILGCGGAPMKRSLASWNNLSGEHRLPGALLIADDVTVRAKQSKSGVSPPSNEARVDHHIPKAKGGSGDPSNGNAMCQLHNDCVKRAADPHWEKD